MALTLLVESGRLGGAAARLRHFSQRLWARLWHSRRRGRQRGGYAPLDDGGNDVEQGDDDDVVEDEDVRAERVMLQAGARARISLGGLHEYEYTSAQLALRLFAQPVALASHLWNLWDPLKVYQSVAVCTVIGKQRAN
jgi:hypothetical protein